MFIVESRLIMPVRGRSRSYLTGILFAVFTGVSGIWATVFFFIIFFAGDAAAGVMLRFFEFAELGTEFVRALNFLELGEWPQHLSVGVLYSFGDTIDFSCFKISQGLSQWTVDLLKVLVQSWYNPSYTKIFDGFLYFFGDFCADSLRFFMVVWAGGLDSVDSMVLSDLGSGDFGGGTGAGSGFGFTLVTSFFG